MRTLKLVIAAFFMFALATGYSQKVDYNGITYLVKDNFIFMKNKDITNTLTEEQQAHIKNKLKQEVLADRKLKDAVAAQKKAEKSLKKVERKQAKAKKEIQRAEKAKKRYWEAQDKLERDTKRYQKLIKKGSLSPNDEIKWERNIKKLKIKIDRLKKNL